MLTNWLLNSLILHGDGATIPKGQHCKKFGGKGATPPLRVSNIPAEADAIVVEFNDLDFQPLSKKGGHGKIGFEIEMGAGEAELVAVPGGTKKIAGRGLAGEEEPRNRWLVQPRLSPAMFWRERQQICR